MSGVFDRFIFDDASSSTGSANSFRSVYLANPLGYMRLTGTLQTCPVPSAETRGTLSFASAPFTFSVEEGSSSQTFGAANPATSSESRAITYSLEGTDASNFSVDSSTGIITQGSSLDFVFDTKSSYSLKLVAKDTLNPPLVAKADVTINVTRLMPTTVSNPEFLQPVYTYRINSGSSAHISIFVRSTIPNSSVDLEIISHTGSGFSLSSFKVEERQYTYTSGGKSYQTFAFGLANDQNFLPTSNQTITFRATDRSNSSAQATGVYNVIVDGGSPPQGEPPSYSSSLASL